MSTPAFPTLRDCRLTSPFGWRTHPITGLQSFHTGTDYAPKIPGTTGLPVYATQSGKVMRRRAHATMGNYIYLEHIGDSLTSVYMHLASFTVQEGQAVLKGQQIGIMGTTGSSTNVHLHFGVATSYPPDHHANGNLIDPETYLQGAVDGGVALEPICKNNYLTRGEMTNNAEIFLAYMTADGWTKNAICGMLGNIETESTINPCLWQSRISYDHDPYALVEGHGYGLVQWAPFSKFTRWARDAGRDYKDMFVQMDRIKFEIERGIQWISTSAYPLSFQEFKVSNESPEWLAQAFLKNYERPANQNQPNRSTQARYWFDNLTGSAFIDPENPYGDEQAERKKKMFLINSRRIQHRRRR